PAGAGDDTYGGRGADAQHQRLVRLDVLDDEVLSSTHDPLQEMGVHDELVNDRRQRSGLSDQPTGQTVGLGQRGIELGADGDQAAGTNGAQRGVAGVKRLNGGSYLLPRGLAADL